MVFQRFFKDKFFRVFQGSFKSQKVSSMFQGSFWGVLREFQGGIKKVFTVFQECF